MSLRPAPPPSPTGTLAPADVVAALGRVANPPVALHEPEFAGNEWRYVKDTLDSGWVSYRGAYVERFERDLAAFIGAKAAIAVVNGTAALHVALVVAGVKPGDEVIVPSLTFIATANAVTFAGAITHFVDVEESTLGMDPVRLDRYLDDIVEHRGGIAINRLTGRRIGAVMPMHTFGHPVDLDLILEVCERHGIPLVEDAAESLGSYYKGRHTGNHGLVAGLSFNGNKIATTGGGGAILTNDEALAGRARHLTTTAKLPHRWEFIHDEVGFNYRLPNLNAALGCAQLEELDGFIADKRRLADRYVDAFAGVPGLAVVREPEFGKSNYWLNAILLDPANAALRDPILEATNDAGFMTRPVWRLIHRLPMYAASPRMDLPVSESIEARLINIPSSAKLGRAGAGA
ncbi:MAG TPA: LegC family aminotransferase [Candidatus Limnocylindrales bacterium]